MLLALAAVCVASLVAAAPALATVNVSTETQLRTAITTAASGETIVFDADITLTQDLPAVQSDLTIDGNGHFLSGNDQFRGFFVGAWDTGTSTQVPVTVAIQNLTIDHARAQGGSGANGGLFFAPAPARAGGGGAGLGGALFVANQAIVSLANVELTTGSAVGGNGGGPSALAVDNTGGGGGLGGNGNNGGIFNGGGGGGLGVGADGGVGGVPDTGTAGDPGIATGAAGGASGSGSGGGAGGSDGGGGGGGGVTPASGGGGGVGAAGSLGGFGGGGGGGGVVGGAGGFGGGGGGGSSSGAGGFAGGSGGGTGGSNNGGGGGGAGLGGALFVQQGGSVTVTGSLSVNGNTVSGGAGSVAGQSGQAFGGGIFLQGDDADHSGAGSLAFSPASGETQTVSDAIADQTGSGGSGGNAGAWGLTKSGAGILALTGANTYTGITRVNDGTLAVNGSLPSDGQGVTVLAAGTLAGTGTVGDVGVLGTLAPGNSVGTLHTGAVVMNAASPHYAVEIGSGGADRTDATGTVALGGSLDVSLLGGFTPTPRTRFTIIHNDGSDPVSGTFSGKPEGSTFSVAGNPFRISYVAGDGNDVRLTSLATPDLATNASSAVTVGGQIHDTGTLSGGANPTRTITFRLYGPKDPSCSGAPRFTDRATVAGNGDYDSADFTPTRAGTYRWTASYSGDGGNEAASTACGDPGESVVVDKASPNITTNASPDVALGGQVHDTATLADGVNPRGKIVFRLYGRGDAACSNSPTHKSAVAVAGDGDYSSPDYTPARPGTYRWTATYSGDANNNAAATACNDPNESVTVG